MLDYTKLDVNATGKKKILQINPETEGSREIMVQNFGNYVGFEIKHKFVHVCGSAFEGCQLQI